MLQSIISFIFRKLIRSQKKRLYTVRGKFHNLKHSMGSGGYCESSNPRKNKIYNYKLYVQFKNKAKSVYVRGLPNSFTITYWPPWEALWMQIFNYRYFAQYQQA